MPARVQVIAGPAGSGKTESLLARYRDSLRQGPLGASLWISPTHRSAAAVREQLLHGELRACLRPAVMTFSQFAEQVLAAGDQVVEPITDLAKRQILRRLLRVAADAGKLPHFRPIAGTSGLADVVVAWISELKRHEIWPEDFDRACRQRGLTPRDRELILLYHDYQRHLQECQLYDAEGRFWSARELLRAGLPRPFAGLRHMVVDGFTDFTRTQHEILALLADCVETLFVSLPLEAETDRGDLFAKPRRTLEQLRTAHPALEFEMLPRRRGSDWPALSHVEVELFKSPRLVRPCLDAGRIEILQAARAMDELYLIGRKIKRLLVEGDAPARQPVRPEQIAVVIRSPSAVATLVREAFDDLGLPYALDEDPPLSQAPIAVALVALVRLHVEDWPFRGLLALWTNNFFAPRWPEWRGGASAQAADATVRSLQIARGREALIAALERTCAESFDDRDPRAASRHAAARDTLALVRRLSAAFARLPARATFGAWARALAALAAESGLAPAPDRPGDERFAPAEREAWNLILESLSAAERFTGGQDAPPIELDLPEIYDVLTDSVRTAQVHDRQDEVGRVRVLSATSARALSIPYLFFAGLSERAFPPAERADRLYSEAEYERLAAAGLPLVLRSEASQAEMMLFYEVLSCATRRLYLSYPGLDEKGQPLLPSPFLTELEQVLGSKVERFTVEDLSPIPTAGEVASPTEQRIVAVAAAAGILPRVERGAADRLPGDPGALLAGLARAGSRDLFDNLLTGLMATLSRGKHEGFGPYEGMLTGASARERLAQRFGPTERWSASRLERYRKCPYQFFLADVLHLAPVEELSLATDHLARGSIVHDALARLHRELNERLGAAASPAAPPAADVFRRAAEALLAELAVRAERHPQPFERALAEIDRRLLRQWLDDYLDQHAAYDELWRAFQQPPVPAHFEVTFGEEAPPGAGNDGLSSAEPLALVEGQRRALVRGRIDRLDLGRVAGQPIFNVLDYKTGQSRSHAKSDIVAGDALQAFLYVLAAEQLLKHENRLPWRTGYWFISSGGYKDTQALSIHELADNQVRATDEWQALRDQNITRILDLIDAIRAGEFAVSSRDDHCTSHCSFHTVCRVNQVRSLEKAWHPPTLGS